jgi:hypothetical protein
MMFLAGAAQHVLGTLGSLQQAAANAQNGSATGTTGQFNLSSLAQGAGTASPTAGGSSTWWSSPGTMNALLSAQDSGQNSGNGVASSGLTAPASGHHGDGHYHPYIGGNQQNAAQNADGIGATTGGATSSGGITGLLSNLLNQQLMSGSASIGQSLSTLV